MSVEKMGTYLEKVIDRDKYTLQQLDEILADALEKIYTNTHSRNIILANESMINHLRIVRETTLYGKLNNNRQVIDRLILRGTEYLDALIKLKEEDNG